MWFMPPFSDLGFPLNNRRKPPLFGGLDLGGFWRFMQTQNVPFLLFFQMPPLTPAQINALIAQQLAAVIPAIVEQVTVAITNQPHQPNQPNQNPQDGTYKEFLYCKPTEFDGKGGALILNQWFQQAKSVFDISNCGDHNRVRYATHLLKGKALTWWNSEL